MEREANPRFIRRYNNPPCNRFRNEKFVERCRGNSMSEISRISDTILPVKCCTPPDRGKRRRGGTLCVEGFEFREYLDARVTETRMDSEEIFDVRGCALRIVVASIPRFASNFHDFIKATQ